MGQRDRLDGEALFTGLLRLLGLCLLDVRIGRSVQHSPQHIIGLWGVRVHGQGA